MYGDVVQLVEGFACHKTKPLHHVHWMWWQMPVISALRTEVNLSTQNWGEEDQKFRVNLSYIVSLKPGWSYLRYITERGE